MRVLFISVARVQVVKPAEPTAGFVQFHVPVPPVIAIETNVVFAGVVSVTEGAVAVFGPLLITVIV